MTMNAALRTVLGEVREDDDLVTLDIFDNHAEYRGFLRGFATVGPVQRLRLPGQRVRSSEAEVILCATRLATGGPADTDVVVGIFQHSPAPVPPAPEPTDLLDELPLPVMRVDATGQISYRNDYAQRLLPIPPNATDKLADIDVQYTIDDWGEHLHQARQYGQRSYDSRWRKRDGSVFPVRVTLCAVRGFPAQSALVVADDLSELRRQEAQLRAQEENAQTVETYHASSRGAPPSVALVSVAPAYDRIREQIKLVAETDATVLITGETGTGKELVARAIHSRGPRSKDALVVVNCGALPRDLIESELFGHQKGAFTGANRTKLGRFAQADRGTIFLDEIGEMPLELQTRLLRFLQEGEFTPVGAERSVHVDVRVIAATNRDLKAMVEAGDFRADLYFRLNVFPIHTPPLRERREDIGPLVDHFIGKHRSRIPTLVETCPDRTLERLAAYDFPGNIRELENIVERALITSPGRELELDWDVGSDEGATQRTSDTVLLPEVQPGQILSLEDMQRRYIEAVLQQVGGKVSGQGGAAELLGMNPQTLFSKIRKLNVKR